MYVERRAYMAHCGLKKKEKTAIHVYAPPNFASVLLLTAITNPRNTFEISIAKFSIVVYAERRSLELVQPLVPVSTVAYIRACVCVGRVVVMVVAVVVGVNDVMQRLKASQGFATIVVRVVKWKMARDPISPKARFHAPGSVIIAGQNAWWPHVCTGACCCLQSLEKSESNQWKER